MNNDGEFDKSSDKIEEETRVSRDDDAIDRSNRLDTRVSDEEARVAVTESDSKGFRVSEMERSESDGDSEGKVVGVESRVYDVKEEIIEQNDDESDRIENAQDLGKDNGSDYTSLLSEFDDYVANDRIGGGTSRALSYGFEVGDMVWGKVKSHPWWPGHIFNEAFASSSVRRTRREGHVLVAFFGDSSYGWFDPAELIPFDRHFMEKSQQTNSRMFVKAVEEAMDEASRRHALGLTCKCRNPYNFRPTNVQGYLAIDVPDYEPNAVYSVNQIRNARNSFKPTETLLFLKELASAPVACDQKSIEFLTNKATVFSYRRAVFEEFDETYAQAFGAQPSKPANSSLNSSKMPVKQPPRAPLSGPLVIAEALGGGKSSKKPMKVKEHSKKDRYLFKRRDEANDLQASQISQGMVSSSVQSTYREGSPTFAAGDYVLQKRAPVSQNPVKQEQADNEVAIVNQTSAQDAATDVKPSLNKIDGALTSSQQEGEATFDLKPDLPSSVKLGGGQGLDQVQDGRPGGEPTLPDVKRPGGMSIEGGVKKAKKRPLVDTGFEISLGEKKKKKKKKEFIRETTSNKSQKSFIIGKGGPKSAQIGFGSREESQVSHPKRDLGSAAATVSLNSGLELVKLLDDLHALALDPFYGVERNCPTTIRQFFLRYRSLVYQKSLVLSPPSEMESVETHSTKPPPLGGASDAPVENLRDSTPKSLRPVIRPDDPAKAGRKRIPSDRQEDIAAKRIKKISHLKSLTAEKKAHLRTLEAPKGDGKEQPIAGAPPRPVKKLDSARRMDPPPRAIEPTMLTMKFPPHVSLPSVAELKAKFGRFGSLDQSAIRVFWKTSTCRVVFKHKIDAQSAYRHANGNNPLFGNVNVKYHLRSVEAPSAEGPDSDKARGDEAVSEAIRVKDPVIERSHHHQPPIPQPAIQLKSCLKKLPTNDEAGQGSGGNGVRGTARVKFMLGGEETSRGDQMMVGNRNNFNNASFADAGATPSVAMEFNSKNFQKIIPPSSSPSPIEHPIPHFGKTTPSNLHHTEVLAPRNAHNLNTQTMPLTTPSIDISNQMLSLLTRCHDIVTNVTDMLGYVPYHPL